MKSTHLASEKYVAGRGLRVVSYHAECSQLSLVVPEGHKRLGQPWDALLYLVACRKVFAMPCDDSYYLSYEQRDTCMWT